MYYAAINSHSTDTSVGFANTWSAIGFPSRKARDAYVIKATDLATKAIKASELSLIGAKRGHISYYTADGVMMSYCGMNDGVAQFIAAPSADEPATISKQVVELQWAAKSPKIGDHTHTVITVDDYDDRGNDLNVDIDILTIGINKATGIAIGCDQSGGLYFDLVRAGSAQLGAAAEWGWVWANGVAGLPVNSRISISPDMIELGMRHTAKYRAECALQKRKAKAYDDLQNEGCEGFNPYSR